MNTKLAKQFCPLSPECEQLLKSAVNSMGLSARSYYKVIKVARTAADLKGEKEISPSHLSEALMFRPRQDDLI